VFAFRGISLGLIQYDAGGARESATFLGFQNVARKTARGDCASERLMKDGITEVLLVGLREVRRDQAN
jgi:hypothetical protein